MRFVHFKRAAWLVGLGLACALAGCSNPSQPPSAEQEEIQKLRAENAKLPELRKQHQEVERLRQELQEIHKLRAQRQDLVRLRQENEQLRAQAAKIAASAAQKEGK